jgi:hypothetical protein
MLSLPGQDAPKVLWVRQLTQVWRWAGEEGRLALGRSPNRGRRISFSAKPGPVSLLEYALSCMRYRIPSPTGPVASKRAVKSLLLLLLLLPLFFAFPLFTPLAARPSISDAAEGDGLVFAFHTLKDALLFAMDTQSCLLHAHWPKELLALPQGQPTYVTLK